jgi:hypothetical protein
LRKYEKETKELKRCEEKTKYWILFNDDNICWKCLIFGTDMFVTDFLKRKKNSELNQHYKLFEIIISKKNVRVMK